MADDMEGAPRTTHDADEPGIHRLLVEQTRELLCVHGADGRFAFVSPSVVALLGYRPDELLGTDPLDLAHDEDRASVREGLRAVVDNQEVPVLTARFRRADATYVWIETQARALRNGDGTISRFVTSSRDVSGRVRLHETVQEREATLRSVIASFDDLVFVFDADGRFTQYYQPSGHPDLYAPPEAFVGRHFSEMLPEAVSQPLATALEHARRDGEAQDFEYELQIDGRSLRFHAKLTPMLEGNGPPCGFVGVVRDVTDRRTAEAERLALARATERAERLEGLSTLARGTAHEFNNLLTTIQGNTQLVLEAVDGRDPAAEHLQEVLAAAERATTVTHRLVRYAGRAAHRFVPLDLAATVRSVEAEVRPDLTDATNLETRIDSDAPTVGGDPTLLEAALRHLVANAVEALPDGDGTVTINVGRRVCTAEELGGSVIEPNPAPGVFCAIEVGDDGEGIQPQLLGRIFDPFMTTRVPGRGLGLAEVWGTIQTHGGAVLVESAPGSGTSVVVLLPARAEGREA